MGCKYGRTVARDNGMHCFAKYCDCNCHYRLGLAYAGSNRDDVITHLTPVFSDPRASIEVGFWLQLFSIQIIRLSGTVYASVLPVVR